jgi:hypothetical protein
MDEARKARGPEVKFSMIDEDLLVTQNRQQTYGRKCGCPVGKNNIYYLWSFANFWALRALEFFLAINPYDLMTDKNILSNRKNFSGKNLCIVRKPDVEREMVMAQRLIYEVTGQKIFVMMGSAHLHSVQDYLELIDLEALKSNSPRGFDINQADKVMHDYNLRNYKFCNS